MTPDVLQLQIGTVQPDLTAFRGTGGLEVRGIFRLTEDGKLLDEFSIAAFFPDSFPDGAPRVWEVGGRIPRIADRHVNPRDGTVCCFTAEDYVLWRIENGSVGAFLEGPLRNYFLSQVHFMEKGRWPFGERPHGTVGRLDFYREIFGLPTFTGLPELLEKLKRKRFKGHHQCPCGSGSFIRRCHPKIIAVERYFPDSSLQEAVDIVRKALEQLRQEYQIRQAIARAIASINRRREVAPLGDTALPLGGIVLMPDYRKG